MLTKVLIGDDSVSISVMGHLARVFDIKKFRKSKHFLCVDVSESSRDIFYDKKICTRLSPCWRELGY